MNQEKDKNFETTSIYEVEPSMNENSMVQEPSAAYAIPLKKQGEYTIEDYRNWPEDQRVELFDGEIIVMEAPSSPHQITIGELHVQIANYIRERKGKCLALFSPLDVQIDEDDKTMVQPDLVILCDRSKLKQWGIFGAPDFLLEVVSPSSRTYDTVRKRKKYIAAGVREYWIIDLEKNKLIIYAETNQYTPVIYPLEGKVGIAIYENDLKVDLDVFKEAVAGIE